MKKLLLGLIAMMGVLSLTAQSVYENEVINTIMARRSIRQYLDKPVEHEKLAAVVHAGINAPSGMNRQPWIIRVVENQQLIAEVNEVLSKRIPNRFSVTRTSRTCSATRLTSSACARLPRVAESWMPDCWARTSCWLHRPWDSAPAAWAGRCDS